MFAESSDGTNSAPIELDGRTNAVDTRAQYDHTTIGEVDVVFDGVIGHVEVVGERREFGGDSINLLDEGRDAGLLTKSSDSELCRANTSCQLAVREAVLLGVAQEIRRKVRDVASTVK